MCKNRAMTVFKFPERHHIAVLVRHGLIPMEVGLVHQLFGAARAADGVPLYEVITCALTPGEIRTDADFTMGVAHGPEALVEADTVIVPAAHEEDQELSPGGLCTELADAVASIRSGTRVASICTGAFVLAAAGLLDGRRATTHWNAARQFHARFPLVDLEPSVLYVDEGKVLTAAGEASGIDLCLHMIRRDHGSAVANEVARKAVVPPHRDGGQAQFIRRPVPKSASTSADTTRAWAIANLDRELTLRDLATHASQSIRTFTRRFRDEVGMSPTTWLTQQRVERAQLLLEETDFPIDRIATDVGFGSATSLRQHFHAAIGTAPSAYRSTFRG